MAEEEGFEPPMGALAQRIMEGWRKRRDSNPDGGVGTEAYGGMAEEEGFEPPIPFQVRQFSRLEPSTTRPLFPRKA